MQMLGGKSGGQSEGGFQGQQRPAAAPQQNQGYQQQPQQGQQGQQYQKPPAQGAPQQQNQGFNQAPSQQAPMAEPDFDFDDDIPF